MNDRSTAGAGAAARVLAMLLAAFGHIFCLAPARAQEAYPSKNIRLVVSQQAGGAADLIARTFVDRLAESMKATIVVENQPGANGSLAAGNVARAEPDGHTLFFAIDTNLAVNPHLYSNLTYDPFKDFAPISVLAKLDTVLLTHPSVPVATVQELIAYSKANPDKLNYASVSLGSIMHLGTELLKLRTGARLTHVPYRGTAPAMTDLTSGVVQMMFIGQQAASGLVEAGKLRALAIAGPNRSQLMPSVPTMAEAGVPNLHVSAWFALLAPARTPPAVIARLTQEAAKATAEPGIRTKLAKQGIEVVGSTPEEMLKLMHADSAMWRDLIKQTGISIPR